MLITHLHADHCLGLAALLRSLAVAGHSHRVSVTGPEGIRALVETSHTITCSKIRFPVEYRELSADQLCHRDVVSFGGSGASRVDVTAHWLLHRVPSFGFVFSVPAQVRLDRAKAEALGVAPGPAFGRLARGIDEALADGTLVRSTDVTFELTPARKLVVLGDTCDSSAALEAAADCDLLVHEATFDSGLHAKAIERKHSTAQMAGQFAAAIRAKRMILTHFSVRYHDERQRKIAVEPGTPNDTPVATSTEVPARCFTVQALVREAQEQCPGCEVDAAFDLMETSLP